METPTAIEKIRCALAALTMNTEQVEAHRGTHAWLTEYGNDKEFAKRLMLEQEKVLDYVLEKLVGCLEHVGNHQDDYCMVDEFTEKVVNPLYDCAYGRFDSDVDNSLKTVKKMEKFSWSYREDEEVYTNTASTIEECIQQATEDNDGEVESVYIGENVTLDVEGIIRNACFCDHILESIADSLDAEAGEAAESWYSGIGTAERDSLSSQIYKAVRGWMDNTENYPYY